MVRITSEVWPWKPQNILKVTVIKTWNWSHTRIHIGTVCSICTVLTVFSEQVRTHLWTCFRVRVLRLNSLSYYKTCDYQGWQPLFFLLNNHNNRHLMCFICSDVMLRVIWGDSLVEIVCWMLKARVRVIYMSSSSKKINVKKIEHNYIKCNLINLSWAARWHGG